MYTRVIPRGSTPSSGTTWTICGRSREPLRACCSEEPLDGWGSLEQPILCPLRLEPACARACEVASCGSGRGAKFLLGNAGAAPLEQIERPLPEPLEFSTRGEQFDALDPSRTPLQRFLDRPQAVWRSRHVCRRQGRERGQARSAGRAGPPAHDQRVAPLEQPARRRKRVDVRGPCPEALHPADGRHQPCRALLRCERRAADAERRLEDAEKACRSYPVLARRRPAASKRPGPAAISKSGSKTMRMCVVCSGSGASIDAACRRAALSRC